MAYEGWRVEITQLKNDPLLAMRGSGICLASMVLGPVRVRAWHDGQ